MARASSLVAFSALAALCIFALCSANAFVPAARATPPALLMHGEAAAAMAATAVAMPTAAEAFYYDGREYFDITYGISPLYWGIAAFCLITYGAILKNAAMKYNKKMDLSPPRTGKFVPQRVQNQDAPYRVKGITN